MLDETTDVNTGDSRVDDVKSRLGAGEKGVERRIRRFDAFEVLVTLNVVSKRAQPDDTERLVFVVIVSAKWPTAGVRVKVSKLIER